MCPFSVCAARSFISDRTSPSRSYQPSAHRSPSLSDFYGSCGMLWEGQALEAVAEVVAAQASSECI
jgi:hypothetical protein